METAYSQAIAEVRDRGISLPVSHKWYAQDRSWLQDVKERIGYNIAALHYKPITRARYLNTQIEGYQQLELGPDGFQIGRYTACDKPIGTPYPLTPERLTSVLLSSTEYFEPGVHEASSWKRNAIREAGTDAYPKYLSQGSGESVESVLDKVSAQCNEVERRNRWR